MNLKSNILKHKSNGRVVYSARTENVHKELQKLNREIINKYNLRMPNRNAIIKTIIQFLSQGDYYLNHNELSFTNLNFKVVKIDIKNFFPSINKHILYRKIVKSSILSDSSIETIKSFIFSNKYMGVPLGLAFSNSLSELYMEDFDSMIQLKWKPLLYVRYVDDILLVVNGEVDESNVINFIKEQLNHLSLEVNSKKTIVQRSNKENFNFTYLGYHFSKETVKVKKTDTSKPKKKEYLIIEISDSKLKSKILNKLVRYFKRYEKNYEKSESFWILYYRLKNLIHGVSSRGENNQIVKFGLSYSYGLINSSQNLSKILKMYHHFVRYHKKKGYLSSKQTHLLLSIISTDNKVITPNTTKDDILSLLNSRYHYEKLTVSTLKVICMRVGVPLYDRLYSQDYLEFYKIKLQKKIMKKLSLRFNKI